MTTNSTYRSAIVFCAAVLISAPPLLAGSLLAEDHGRSAGSLSINESIDRAYNGGTISADQAVLYKLYSVLDAKRLPSEYQSNTTKTQECGAAVVWSALRMLAELPPETLDRMGPIPGERPEREFYFDSSAGHFRIHYDRYTAHAVPLLDSDGDFVPDYVEHLADYAEESWAQQVDVMGYRQPPSDDGKGGSAAYDIYCSDLGSPGAVFPEDRGPLPWDDYSSYVLIHKDFVGWPANSDPEGNELGNAKMWTAHLFHHACQLAYDDGQLADAFAEQTAAWIAESVFDENNGYLQWLPNYFADATLGLLEKNWSDYALGAMIWPMYLSEVHTESLLPLVWENQRNGQVYPALDALLQADSSSLAHDFVRFVSWNWYTGVRDDGGHYEEGALFPLLGAGSFVEYPWQRTELKSLGAVYSVNDIPEGLDGRPFVFRVLGERDYGWGGVVMVCDTGTPCETHVMEPDPLAESSYDDVYVYALKEPAGHDYAVIGAVRTDLLQLETGEVFFSTCVGPLPIELTSPSDGADAVYPGVTLEWEAGTAAVSYHLQIDDDPDFSSPEIDQWVADNSVTIESGLSTGTGYYWRVDVFDGCYVSGWSPVRQFVTICEVVMTGDVNTDGFITSADVVYLQNYVLKGGPAPLPIWQAGDVNCTGRVTMADVIYLINYVFKGGPPPCDVCSIF